MYQLPSYLETISKDTWSILKLLLTLERISFNVIDELGFGKLNASFIQDHRALDLEPLSLPMSKTPEDFIRG